MATDYKKLWNNLKGSMEKAESLMDALPPNMFGPEYVLGAKTSYVSVTNLMEAMEKGVA